MALMGFIVYQIPAGPSHAIGHQLGSVANVMHGVTSCIMLPPVLHYTRDSNPEMQDRIVKAFNESLGWEETEAAECVAKLVKILELPSKMSEVGVQNDETIEKIIDNTMTDIAFKFGKVFGREEIAQIVYSAR